MSMFDDGSQAELFAHGGRKARTHGVKYMRFVGVAEAVRHAIEELPREALLAAHLQVDESRFDAAGIRRLYESDEYPLARRDQPARG